MQLEWRLVQAGMCHQSAMARGLVRSRLVAVGDVVLLSYSSAASMYLLLVLVLVLVREADTGTIRARHTTAQGGKSKRIVIVSLLSQTLPDHSLP